MNFSAALPTATPPAAGLPQAAAFGKSATGNSAPGMSGGGSDGSGDGQVSSFGAVLSEKSATDAGSTAPGRGSPSGGPTTSWSRQRSAFEAKLGEAISGSGAAKPDVATSGNDTSPVSTAALAAALGQAAAPSRQGAAAPPAGLALPPAPQQPAPATDANAPMADGSGKPRAKDAQGQDASDDPNQAAPAAALPADPTLAPATLAVPAAQMQAAQTPAAQTSAALTDSGPAQGGGSAPRIAGQASSAAANISLPGSPAPAPDQAGFAPMAAAAAAQPAAPIAQATVPVLGANDLPNPAIGAPMARAAATRGADKGAMPGAATAKQSAQSLTSTLSALLSAPDEAGVAGPLAIGSQNGQGVGGQGLGGQGLGGSASGNGGDKQQAFAPLATVSVVGQETHAAPVMRLTPVQQLANSIVEAAAAPADEPTGVSQAGAAAASTPAAAAARIKPLQVLTITLDPPDLGSVSIKMRLTGQKLDLNIEVAQKDTLPLLDKEGDSLSNALQSSGYTVDNLTIKAASGAAVGSRHQHDPSQGQGQSQGQPQGQAQGQQSASQFSAGSGQFGAAQGGDGRSNQRASAQGQGVIDSGGNTQVGEDVVVQNSPSGDLYL